MMKDKARKAWNLVRSNDGQTATVELYGDVAEERPVNWWTDEPDPGEYIIPAEIQNDLDSIANCPNVDIHINSTGGEVYAAIAIYNKIKNFTGNVTVIIDGIAASAASVIAMAGKTIKMASGALFMIHDPAIAMYDYVQLDDLKKAENWLEGTSKAIAGIYARKTGKSEDEIRDLMKAETWMTDKEAVEMGFADEVAEGIPVQVTMSTDHKMLMAAGRNFDISKCINIPKLKISDKQPSGQAAIHIDNKKEEEEMNLTELKEKYPELYASLMSEATDAAKAAQSKAVKDAVDAEDERIKAIDEIASMCTPEMVQEAKYGEHKCSADTLALRAIKAQKEVQTQMSKNIVEDVKNSGANDVHALGNGGNEPVKPESMEDEVTNIVNKIKEAKK